MFNNEENLDSLPEDQQNYSGLNKEGGDFSSVSSASRLEMDDVSDENIHTMPKKYVKDAGGLPKKKGRISWIIMGILIFVVLGLVIAAAVIYLSKQKNGGQQAEQNNDNIEIVLPQENQEPAPEEPKEQPKEEPDLSTAFLRDQKRLIDVFELRTALDLYFSEIDGYPAELNLLLGKYLVSLPQNPNPGGEAYAYVPNEDRQGYKLNFTLEGQATFGNLKLAPGKYTLTPGGVTPFAETNPLTPSETPQTEMPVLGLDSDQDQLSDIEENIYTTNPTTVDTDGDSYNDGDEVANMYDPTKAGAAKILDSGLVKVYLNSALNYSVAYPEAWVVSSLNENKTEVIFTSSNGEFIEVLEQNNPLSLSAINWYLNQNPGADANGLKTLLIDGLYPGIQTPDGLVTYFAKGNKIYSIVYNIGVSQQIYFSSTYKMFLKSLTFKLPEAQVERENETPPAP